MQMHGLRSILDIFTHLFSLCLEKILGALTKLRKATISTAMSVRPFVRMEQLGYHCSAFYEICY